MNSLNHNNPKEINLKEIINYKSEASISKEHKNIQSPTLPPPDPPNILNNKNILVISGGGKKGMAFLGILEGLDLDLTKFKYLSGSSIGALICTSICFGNNIKEMKSFFLNNDLSKLCPVIYDEKSDVKILSSLVNKFSVGGDNNMKEEMKKIFENKYDYRTLTFKKLFNKSGKELHISGSNISSHLPEYFSYKLTPDMLIYDALLISTRVPLIFPPVEMNGSYYIDGYVLDPFPIRCFDKKFLKKNKDNIIGILSLPKQKYGFDNIFSYLNNIFEALSCQYMIRSMGKFKKNVVTISVNGDLLNLKSTKEELLNMFQLGYEKGIKFKNKNIIRSENQQKK